ncbi:MAG: selenium cofactor biosynthesis protein YqeC [Anaerolineales bacterium]
MTDTDLISFVGGGGKTTAMFRLASEIVAAGGRVITTTTTRIFAAQIKLAPTHLFEHDASRERIAEALGAHRHVLIIGAAEYESGKANGVHPEFVRELRSRFPRVPILNEADGSRMRPFKAPAEHEPMIPWETTLVVPVVGADVFGQPLDGKHVHRPERVAALTGVPLGAIITPEIVARALTHPQGGVKNVPASARVSVLINKVDALTDWTPVRETAALLLKHPRIEAVLLGAVRSDEPVREIQTLGVSEQSV